MKKYKKLPVNHTYKQWIDNASYYDLLKRWRFGTDSAIFMGECGTYYSEIMQQKKNKLSYSECVKISKLIGWG